LIRISCSGPGGQWYGWPNFVFQGRNSFAGKGANLPYINKKWLEKLGIQQPKTTEEFRNTLVAFRDRDPTGTGRRIEIPYLAVGDPFTYLINAFLLYPYMADEPSRLNVTNGRLSTPWTTEEYREALRYINRLYSEGLIPASFFTMNNAEIASLLSYQPGEVNRVGIFAAAPTLTLLNNTPAVYDYTMQGPLIGPRGASFHPRGFDNYQHSGFITKDCKYPEVAFRFLDYWTDLDTTMTNRYGEQNVDWRWVQPNEGIMASFGVGRPAKFMEINVLWGAVHNKHWNMDLIFLPIVTTEDRSAGAAGSWTADRLALFNPVYDFYDKKDAPERIMMIVYTSAEEDSIREIRASINTYREECMALFITGDMSLDRDWNTYLQNLERMGLSRFMQVSQTAYTRMMSR